MTPLQQIARQAATDALHAWTHDDSPDNPTARVADAVTLAVLQQMQPLRELCEEVVESHRNKDSADYNACEAGPCFWCEQVAATLALLSVPPSSGEARREKNENEEKELLRAATTRESIEGLPHASSTEPRPTYKGANGIYVFSPRVRDAVVVAYQMADHDLSNQDAASWLMSAIYDVAIAAHEEMAPPPRPQTPETE